LYDSYQRFLKVWRKVSTFLSKIAPKRFEEEHAEHLLLRLSQNHSFQPDIDKLKADLKSKHLKLHKKFSPFLDEKGILRSNSRLLNSSFPAL